MNDFQFAMEHDAEQALWIAHVRVHKRFQKVLRMVSCALPFLSLHDCVELQTERRYIVP